MNNAEMVQTKRETIRSPELNQGMVWSKYKIIPTNRNRAGSEISYLHSDQHFGTSALTNLISNIKILNLVLKKTKTSLIQLSNNLHGHSSLPFQHVFKSDPRCMLVRGSNIYVKYQGVKNSTLVTRQVQSHLMCSIPCESNNFHLVWKNSQKKS